MGRIERDLGGGNPFTELSGSEGRSQEWGQRCLRSCVNCGYAVVVTDREPQGGKWTPAKSPAPAMFLAKSAELRDTDGW